MSQIWIFFAPGAGGDGLANVIELCHGMQRWRHNPDQIFWRAERVVDDQVKFWAPCVDSAWCFRKGTWFDQSQNRLDAEYEHLVASGRNLVATSHDILLYNLDRSDRQDVLCKDQIRVLLDSRDYAACQRHMIKKNLMTVSVDNFNEHALARPHALYQRYDQCDRSRFDHVVWLEDLNDPSYLQQWLGSIGLMLDLLLLEQYHQLRSGQWRQVLGQVQKAPPVFESYAEQGEIRYRSLDPAAVDQ